MSTELDVNSLLAEFNLPNVSKENLPVLPTTAEIDKKIEEENLSVEQITRRNIERTNRILDKAENQINISGEISAKMLEAVAKLADTISTSSEILSGIELTNKTFEFKERGLDLREFEIKERIKLKQDTGPEQFTQNNQIIVTDRESLLDFLNTNVHNKKQKAIHLEQEINGD